jgi:hypothetical protein
MHRFTFANIKHMSSYKPTLTKRYAVYHVDKTTPQIVVMSKHK